MLCVVSHLKKRLARDPSDVQMDDVEKPVWIVLNMQACTYAMSVGSLQHASLYKSSKRKQNPAIILK